MDQLERDDVEEGGGGIFACLLSLVKLMANIQDSGEEEAKMFKVRLKRNLTKYTHGENLPIYFTTFNILKSVVNFNVRFH